MTITAVIVFWGWFWAVAPNCEQGDTTIVGWFTITAIIVAMVIAVLLIILGKDKKVKMADDSKILLLGKVAIALAIVAFPIAALLANYIRHPMCG